MPSKPNMPSLDKDAVLPKPSEARLTIIQITDVYTLSNFPSLKTLIAEKRAELGSENVISVLTGDFLAPYLLSSVDKGNGMMNAIASTPIDYLTWGNHEADIDHRTGMHFSQNCQVSDVMSLGLGAPKVWALE